MVPALFAVFAAVLGSLGEIYTTKSAAKCIGLAEWR